MSAPGLGRLLHYLDVCTAWALTPYQACEFRCVYCNARTQGVSRLVLPREQLVSAFRRELLEVAPVYAIILGVLTDAYPHVEADLGATRILVRELIHANRHFHIVTKGESVCRDIDLLAPYAEKCRVHVSLCTVDERAIAHLDPGAPSAAARLSVVERLRDAGVPVEVKAAPWIPDVTDVEALLDRVPPGVPVEFAPLSLARYGGRLKLLGKHYTQPAIDRLYRDARGRFGVRPAVRWLDPGAPGHHPFAPIS